MVLLMNKITHLWLEENIIKLFEDNRECIYCLTLKQNLKAI
jgi:hypothetical protein